MMIFNSTIANGLREFQGQADKAAQRIADGNRPEESPRTGEKLYGPDGRRADPLNRRTEGGGYAAGSNVDLAAELIAMKLAQRGSEALINVYKAGDEMIGGLLDELA